MKILLIAPDSNPDSITGALIGYSHGKALAKLHSVSIVIKEKNEYAVQKANGGFYSIEPIPPSRVDKIYGWIFKNIFKEDRGNLLMTAISFPLPILFELSVWRKLKHRIFKGEFDVVLRILPIVTIMPSPLAYFLRKGPIPFVIGPLNGGLPWPKGFSQITRQKAAAGNWVANFRNLYKLLPFAGSTFKKATAIIVGSSNTYRELNKYSDKMFYVTGENGVNEKWLTVQRKNEIKDNDVLKLAYGGRLVPYKACDIAIRGAAPILKSGKALLSVFGDGPERKNFEKIAVDLEVSDKVTFHGNLNHSEIITNFGEKDILIFPSLREFGGGVVYEALAMGVVPIVADYGGPGDVVNDKVGFSIPIVSEEQMIKQISEALNHLNTDRRYLNEMQKNCRLYAQEQLTWAAKAEMVTRILLWAVEGKVKPRMLPPKIT